MTENKIYLHDNWQFKIESTKGKNIPAEVINKKAGKWHPAVVPGTIHTDLMNNKLLPDPFFADNELRTSWVAECDWVYETEFNHSGCDDYSIVFEGLDTVTEIFLNNQQIAKTKNMFRQYEFDLAGKLKKGKNKLKVVFVSPVVYADEQEKKYSKLPVALNSSRVYIRKAQYSFGWDWGPVFPTSGIWRSVYLKRKVKAEIKNFHFQTLSVNEKKARIKINLDFETAESLSQQVEIEIKNSRQENKFKKNINPGSNEWQLDIADALLWWPNCMGEQNLYEVSITIIENNEKRTLHKMVAGIRTIKLLLKENGKSSFKFFVNGKPLFAKGANWIPVDSFIPRADSKKIRNLIEQARDAKMNILRVWGGGVYESDEFYSCCNENGLLVWQDFMFACGAYPEQDEIIEEIKEEIKYNVARIRNNPSLAIWCGNNENEWNWTKEQFSSYKNMPGYKIFHTVIPELLKTLDDSTPYWPSSPFGKGADPNSQSDGNRHQWDIWSFWTDYTEVKKDNSLFVSEFGFQGPANRNTLEEVIPKAHRAVQDRLFEFHNKQVDGPDRLFRFLAAHLPIRMGWNDFIYLAQLNQGLALKTCLEHWATNGITAGSIIWQLNDVWPVTSWSLIDSNSLPKLSYHFVKQVFSDQLVCFEDNEKKLNVKLVNRNSSIFKGICTISVFENANGKETATVDKKINLAEGETRIVDLKKLNKDISEDSIVVATLKKGNEIIARDIFSKSEWKYLQLPEPKICLKIISDNEIEIAAGRISVFTDLYHKDICFASRGFTMLPGEKKIVKTESSLKKIEAADIEVFNLNKYLNN